MMMGVLLLASGRYGCTSTLSQFALAWSHSGAVVLVKSLCLPLRACVRACLCVCVPSMFIFESIHVNMDSLLAPICVTFLFGIMHLFFFLRRTCLGVSVIRFVMTEFISRASIGVHSDMH